MHFCILAFSKEFPTNQVIGKIMDPFKDFSDCNPNPVIQWDYWLIGGRYNGKVKLKVDRKNETEYDWGFYKFDSPRAGRLFRSFLLEDIHKARETLHAGLLLCREEEYYCSIGYRDDFLYVDGAKIEDILNVDDLLDNNWGFITDDGRCGARDVAVDDNFLENVDYDKQIKDIYEDYKNGWVCVIDIHD